MTDASSSRRLPGPDVVRAVAMFGVVLMNYHGYLILRGADRPESGLGHLLDPWRGPLSTRFAALFVLTAGVGVTLLTQRAGADRSIASEVSWRLVRRGLLLYGAGMVFDFIWPGTILPYYGAMFVLAAALWRLSTASLLTVGAAAAASAATIEWWAFNATADGRSTQWLYEPGPRSPRGLLLDVFVNGTHPLLPWLAFFCTGIVVGRLLGKTRQLAIVGGAGALAWLLAFALASDEQTTLAGLVLSSHPFDRGLVYTVSALGSSVAVFSLVSLTADRWPDALPVEALRRAGQLSLSIYVGHALIFLLLVDRTGLVQPDGPGTAIALALVVWTLSTAAGIAWQRRLGRGPLEWLYRRLTA